MLLADMLAIDGHQVDTATHGLAALEKLGRRAYDLLVVDVRMPRLDGPGLYRELQRSRPDLVGRLAFMTGDTLNPATRAFFEEAGLPALHKPFALADLRRLIAQVLEPGGGEGAGEHGPTARS
jgi:CheY-like chemotaxis protein